AVQMAPLGVAQDHERRADVGEHRGADLARERAGALVAAVLGAGTDRRSGERARHLVDVDEGREDGHVDVVARGEALAQRAPERERGLALEVHLPVAGDERLARARCHRPAAPAVASLTSWRRSSAAIAAASCAMAPNTSTEIAWEASERA